ncbi:Hypothetical protein ETEE_0783 [Edwardsiella anguillarum ET080813]|uniref:Uncharacterized protein n=1 Tax=Edwardsiella anguillarum ET080813 TaxID=667120 RepID=A0A076LNJ8_9GAMM|nr:Hypothetical protein ETEE_0783 [Edwardsiella anguillarum ET080813]
MLFPCGGAALPLMLYGGGAIIVGRTLNYFLYLFVLVNSFQIFIHNNKTVIARIIGLKNVGVALVFKFNIQNTLSLLSILMMCKY